MLFSTWETEQWLYAKQIYQEAFVCRVQVLYQLLFFELSLQSVEARYRTEISHPFIYC